MPHRVLRAAMLHWIAQCCSSQDAEQVVDRLIEMGVRPPALTITDQADLDLIPDGAAVAVGDLRRGAAIGVKQEHSVLFAGEAQPWPFHLDGAPPPLPCTVLWLPQEGQTAFSALYARRQARQLGLDEQELLREYQEGTA